MDSQESTLPAGWSFGARRGAKGQPPVPDRRLQDGPGGCRVCAERTPDGGWRFAAWGPDRSAGWSYRDWSNGAARHWSGEEPRAHYARGELIPQPAVFYGFFASAAAARAACEAVLATAQR